MATATTRTYTLLADQATLDDRLLLASECAAALRRYRDNFHELERRPGIDARMTERAYEAERNYRVLIKLGLDCINEIWDSGDAAALLHRPSATEADFGRGFAAAVPAAKDFFTKWYPGADVSPLDDASQLIQQYKIQIAAEDHDAFTLSLQSATGRQQKQKFHIQPRAGDTGRVSSDSFFAAGFSPAFARIGMYQDDCHMAAWSTALKTPPSQSMYGTLVGSLAVARETIYSHAREVEQYGPAFARGAGPAAIPIAVAAIAIGILLLGAGATILVLCATGNAQDPDICSNNVGWWLLGGGIALIGAGVCIMLGGNCIFGNTDPKNWKDPEMPNDGGVGGVNFPMNSPSTS